MAITGGFFNSINGDRKYFADQVNGFFKGLVGSGVFQNVDGGLRVVSGTGMQVQVSAGKLVDSKGRWMINDASLNLDIDAADVTLNRYDAIVAKIDSSLGVRGPEIYVKKGATVSTPTRPTMERNAYIEEYCLAYVYVGKGVTSITQSAITDTRPNNKVCGFVTGLIDQLDTSQLFDQYQTAFEEWFDSIKEYLATSTLIRSYESTYIAKTENETVIPINIPQFNKELDIFQVYINGMKLLKDTDFTLDSNAQITLTKAICSGTPINFTVYKSVDGSNAETVVQQVYELQQIVEKSKITANNGNVKLSITDNTKDVLTEFISLGVGFHTIYTANGVQGVPDTGAFRMFGHLTNTNPATGYIIAMQADGSVYANYCNVGTWRGWKSIFEATPPLLYQSANGAFPNAEIAVTPTKALSECQHGWALIFTGYDDTAKAPRDYYVQTVYIPKRSYKGEWWSGESMTFSLVYSYSEANDTNLQCTKTFTVYNDRIVSSRFNSQGVSRNMVLRSIHEY